MTTLSSTMDLDALFQAAREAAVAKEAEKRQGKEVDAMLAKLRKPLPRLSDTMTSPELLKTNKKTGVTELCVPEVALASDGSKRALEVIPDAPITNPPRLTKKQKKEMKEKTSGKEWFSIPKPTMTPELERDIKLLKLRSALDPKRFYKKDNTPISPYFHVGRIIEGPTEFYSARLARKERKETLVDELLSGADERRSWLKKRYLEVQERNASGKKGFYKKIKDKRAPKWKRSAGAI